ncbi:hypothetical protein ABZ942_42675, partial [Nocardia sp. NPDC046473]|uniref:hypothetical protein n=1 Tax=Nocardia sp. NPDC046473 TaxID=3155733 RepID=UPI0033CABD69
RRTARGSVGDFVRGSRIVARHCVCAGLSQSGWVELSRAGLRRAAPGRARSRQAGPGRAESGRAALSRAGLR